MIRGLYTAASGMEARQIQLDVISNNLANVNTAGFKKDVALFKAFPEMLMRRMNSEGVTDFPLGSYDRAPIAGKIGTGVEINDIRPDLSSNGLGLVATEQDFDLALQGDGFFAVETPQGERYTRGGNFTIDDNGYLVNHDGFQVLSETGPIRIQRNNFRVDEFGNILTNPRYDGADVVDRLQNSFDQEAARQTLRIVTFMDPRELVKEGNGFFRQTAYSGEPLVLNPGEGRPTILQGYLETSNVKVVEEMVNMIATHRAYESGARMLKSHDELLGRAFNETMRV